MKSVLMLKGNGKLPKVLSKTLRFTSYFMQGTNLLRSFPLISTLLDIIEGDSVTLTRASAASVIKDDGTTVDATSGAPRYTGSGIVVHQSLTNYLRYNEEPSNAAWGANTRVSIGSGVGDLGTWIAYPITSTSTNSTSYLGQTVTLSANSDNTVWCIAKINGGNATHLAIQLNYIGNSVRQYFNLSNGTVASVSASTWSKNSAKIVDLGNGYYFCAVNVHVTATGIGSQALFMICDGDGDTLVNSGDSLIMCRPSVVRGTTMLDAWANYTTSAAVTVAAENYAIDLSSVPLNNFQLYIEAKPQDIVTGGKVIYGNDATNGIEIDINGSGNWELTVTKNTTGYTLDSGVAAAIGTNHKFLVTMSSSSGIAFEVSGTEVTNTNADAFTAALPSSSYIGSTGSASYINGVISNVKWRAGTDLTLAQMEAL